MRVIFTACILLGLLSGRAHACTTQTEIRDVIGPATVDLLKRVQKSADHEKCTSVLLLINTPGGSLDSTRTIVEMILNSPIPYLCLVAPSGGHAGSAGAIILQACHVNGALHGTNLGAATPIALGQDLPKDLRRKILNDTRSWLEGLTKLRGRSTPFGQDIITDAKAVTAEEAFKLHAVDFLGDDVTSFVKFANGREVKMGDGKMAEVRAANTEEFPLDTRYKVVSLLTDPELAYMLLLGSLALLYFEFTHPGAVLPGVAGAIGLVIALIAMNKLEVEWAGLLLIFLGVGMLVAELFLPTFGVIGFGGIVAVLLGSLFLFDPVKTGGYRLPLPVILPVVLVFATAVGGISLLLWRTRRMQKKSGFDELVGMTAKVVKVTGQEKQTGYVELRGETWKFEATSPLAIDDAVKVTGYRGLVLHVVPK